MYTTKLCKVRGSVMLAVPASLLDQLGLQSGATVGLMIERGRLVVEPKPAVRYTLSELIGLSDYGQSQPVEEREWIDAPGVGGELL